MHFQPWRAAAAAMLALGLALPAAAGTSVVGESTGLPAAQPLYVATTGSDSNPGTLAAPFQTIGRAQTAARAIIASGATNLTVTLRGGTYPIASTLNLTSADSGISYGSYPGEDAILSGGVPITGWTLCTTADAICSSGTTGVYEAAVTPGFDFRELYTNGIHATRARGPTIAGLWTVTSTGFTAPSSVYASYGNRTDIEIVSTGGWQNSRCNVASIVGTAVTMQTPCWTLFYGYTYPQYTGALCSDCTISSWVENAYELLTAADCPSGGCWYLNQSTNIVYYLPRAGENMATVPVVAPSLQHLVSANGVANVSFNRLTFSYTSWLTLDTGGVGYITYQNGYLCTGSVPGNCTAAGGATQPSDAALTFSGGSNHVTLSHDSFTHLAQRAVFFAHGSQDGNFLANICADNGGGCLQWGDITDAAQSNPSLQTTGLVAENNSVGAPFEYLDQGGIFVPIATNSLIANNEILPNPWAGLTIGWGWNVVGNYNNGNTPTDNYIHGQCEQMADCGDIVHDRDRDRDCDPDRHGQLYAGPVVSSEAGLRLPGPRQHPGSLYRQRLRRPGDQHQLLGLHLDQPNQRYHRHRQLDHLQQRARQRHQRHDQFKHIVHLRQPADRGRCRHRRGWHSARRGPWTVGSRIMAWSLIAEIDAALGVLEARPLG